MHYKRNYYSNFKFALDAKHSICALCCATLTLGLLFGLVANISADTLTLDRAISEALAHNGMIESARQMAQSANDTSAAEPRWEDPMFMVGAVNVPTNWDFQMDDMTMKMIGARIPITYNGRSGLQRKSATALANAAVFIANDEVQTIIALVRKAYAELYFNQRILSLRRKQLAIMGDLATSVRARTRDNAASDAAAFSAQAEVWRMEAMIAEESSMVNESARMLAALCGMEGDSSMSALAAPPANIPDSAGLWIEQALMRNPTLRRLKAQAESYHYTARANRRMRWPMLAVSGSYGFRSGYATGGHEVAERDDMVSYQVELTLPLFSFSKQSKMARSMDRMSFAAEVESEQEERELRANLASLFARAQTLAANATAYQSRIAPTSRDALRAQLTAFENNRASFSDVIMAASAALGDEITVIESERELSFILADANRLVAGGDLAIGTNNTQEKKAIK